MFSRDHGRIGLIARGVRGVRGQGARALLQPLQPLLLSWRGRGELPVMAAAEAAGAAIALHGESLLSAFYLNELLLRLLPRGEAQTALFWRYVLCLAALAEPAAHIGWELRRFERDLLDALGYGLQLHSEADNGAVLEPAARYLLDPESGPRRVVGERGISGTALIALRDDARPDPDALRELRHCMRGVLRHHLGGRDLHSWQVLGALAAVRVEDGR